MHDFLVKKSVAVERSEQCEVIFNITHTASDDYSLVFTSSALYLFHDDDDVIENPEPIAQQESQETILMNIYELFRQKNHRMSSSKYNSSPNFSLFMKF